LAIKKTIEIIDIEVAVKEFIEVPEIHCKSIDTHTSETRTAKLL